MGTSITLANGDSAEFAVYIAEPAEPVKGAVVLIHDIWGLVGQITDVAELFAKAGYVTAAPDLLSRAGADPETGQLLFEMAASTDPAVREVGQPRLDEVAAAVQSAEFVEAAQATLMAVLDYLDARTDVAARIGVVGFGFGGARAFDLAGFDVRLGAAVSFYGGGPVEDWAATLICPLLAFYAEDDPAVTPGLPAVAAAMTAAESDFTSHVYPGTVHGFFNHHNPSTYHPDAAGDSWDRTLAFLGEKLQAS